VEGILGAKDDRRIKGLLLTIDGTTIGLAKIQELRDAVLEFRKSGKWAAAFMETVGEFSPGTKEYYLATSCDTIWIAPSGDVSLTGVRLEVPFIRGSLDKLGIYPDFDHIGKYKTFKNLITDTSMTPAYRESMEAVADGFYGQVRAGIAAGRGLSAAQVSSLIDRGPFTGPRAFEAKLVDNLGYRDQLETHLKEKNGGVLPIITLRSYLRSGRLYDGGTRVALIYAMGAVARGESGYDPIVAGPIMGSDTLAEAIKKAREDASIKAIVLRVDSPGGSYVASDLIWHQVALTRGVKPVVASMSDVAASGGYFVAMGADRIIAEPATLTGSIGVLAGKFVTRGFWEKLGVTREAVQRGRHAAFYSGSARYTPEERAIFEQWLRRIYLDFVEKAAKGRDKSFGQIDAIAQGRVWTGEDAMRLGLVDEIGGLALAISRALERAGVEPTGRANLVVFPPPKGLLQELLGGGEETRSTLDVLAADVRRALEEGPARGPESALEMPFVPSMR
jgi:protease-4